MLEVLPQVPQWFTVSPSISLSTCGFYSPVSLLVHSIWMRSGPDVWQQPARLLITVPRCLLSSDDIPTEGSFTHKSYACRLLAVPLESILLEVFNIACPRLAHHAFRQMPFQGLVAVACQITD